MSIRLFIDSLDERGAGIGHVDGRALHVPGALPGESVRAHLEHTSPHRAVGWARLLQVDQRSQDRVEPPCAHCGDCGGCPLMHLRYDAQLRAKEERVRHALRGLLGDAAGDALGPIEAAPEPLGYRETAKYVVVRRGGHVLLGSYSPGTHRVADMSGCHVARAPIPAVAAATADLCDETGATPRYVVIRAEDRAVGVVIVAWAPDPRFAGIASELRRRIPEVGSVVLSINPSRGNVILGTEEIPLDGEAFSPRRFRQANPRQARRLYADLASAAADGPHQTVFDLYCGAGAIAEALATLPRCDIVAVDREPASPRGARFVCSDAAAFLKSALPADLIVVNPPRRGLGDAVCQQLVGNGCPRLFYVSCMPETFAKDVERLRDRFAIEFVRPYDLLPQTPHIELFARLRARS